MVPLDGRAFERKDHDKLMLEILFNQHEYAYQDVSVEDDISAITSACYLTIDQFNSYGQKYLDELISYGVKDIPSQVSEIGYSASGRNHRDYTHRGWDFAYAGEMKTKWPIRQTIMLNTVGTVFDFGKNEKQKEAFCELLYYIHILGDHLDDESYTISNGRKIDVGGRHDKNDIVHKLLDAFPTLFEDQVQTHKYRSLTSNLRSLNNSFDELVNSPGGIDSEEKFEKYKQLTLDLTRILSLYLPKMLKEEPFFNQVFYSDIAQTDVIGWLEDKIRAA